MYIPGHILDPGMYIPGQASVSVGGISSEPVMYIPGHILDPGMYIPGHASVSVRGIFSELARSGYTNFHLL